MATNTKAGYFYIGLFTLIGLSLLVATLVIFGSKNTYENAVYVETYFNESVQGLTVGSPVKYRGMEIGKIIDIAAITSIYNIMDKKTESAVTQLIPEKYIYVKMAINPRNFQSFSDKDVRKIIEQEVKSGLRVKISVQGLTGNAYIELDYVKIDASSSSNTILPINWQPENYYIPSTPSALSFFSDNAQYIVGELRKIELQKTVSAIKELSDSSKQTFDNMNQLMTTYNHQIMEILSNLQTITQNLKTVSDQAKNNPSSVIFSNPPPNLDPNKL